MKRFSCLIYSYVLIITLLFSSCCKNCADTNPELIKVLEKGREAEGMNIQNTPITCLPPSIGRLTHLRSILLKSNRLEAIAPEIGNLTNLECQSGLSILSSASISVAVLVL